MRGVIFLFGLLSLFLLVVQASDIGDFVGVWRTREDKPDDAQVKLHVCVVEEEDAEGGGHKREKRGGEREKRNGASEVAQYKLYARILDEEKGEYSVLQAELFEISKEFEDRFELVDEFQGTFISGGYPSFSGPGYPSDAHCFRHEFRWSAKEIVFRCNSNDYHKIRLERLSDDRPSDKQCFVPEKHPMTGYFENEDLSLSICVDSTLERKDPFRVRMSGKQQHHEEEKREERVRGERGERRERRSEGLEDGFLEGVTFLEGSVASGQYYEEDSLLDEQGKKTLLIRVETDELLLVTGETILSLDQKNDNHNEHREVTKNDKEQNNEYLYENNFQRSGEGGEEEEGELVCSSHSSFAPSISGAYLAPISGLPEIFVCENDGILTAMYGYVGVFLGSFNENSQVFETIWAESGYSVQNIMGSAELYFTEVGLEGEAVSGEEFFFLAYYRLARGMPPSDLCMAGALNNYTNSSTLEGTWGIEPETTLAICFDDDDEGYHLSYGFADEDNSGGFETGKVNPSLRLSSGVFEEPGDRKGYSLSVLSGDDIMYNIYVYDDTLEGFTEGFEEDPPYGMYVYERVSDEGVKCNYYRDGFSGVDNLKISGVLTTILTFFTLFLFF